MSYLIKRIVVTIVIAVIGFGAYNTDLLDKVGQDLGVSGGDGSAKAADPADCKTVDKVVVVELDPARYPETVDHTLDAIAAGEPEILHIDRAGADANRDDSLAGIPTREGQDRDEYPPAVSAEGGKGADIRYVTSADNRGAGSSMGAQLAPYCSGQAFKVVSG